MRNFIVTPPVVQDEEAEYIIVLPTHKKLAIQARQSSKRQAMFNKESYEYQTKIMLQRAIKLGWPDEFITLLIENKRKNKKGEFVLVDASGTKRIDERPTMQDLWDYIASDEYGAVMTRAIDRLFRHINMIEPALFAEHCKKHNVIVLTERQRFDFNKRPGDTKRFLEEAQKGADYISEHIAMMNRYKFEKALRGEYDGRSVPIGFWLDEDRLRFIIDEERACVVRWLFKRFRELAGNFTALYKEVAALPFLFPFFPDGMQPHGTLGRNAYGYTITPKGLRTLLCNVTYIGWWLVYDSTHTVLQAKLERNHPAIVDEGDFWFAYDILNPEVIDKSTRERFNRRGTISCDALLNGILTSDQKCKVYVNQNAAEPEKATYVITDPNQYASDNTHGSIYVKTLDTLFTNHLLARLEEGKRLRELVKDSFLENNVDELDNLLMVHFIDAVKATQESTKEFDKKLKEYREEAASLDRTLHYGAAKLPGEKIAEYSEKLANLHISIEQLDLKKKRSEIAATEIQKIVDRMDDIPGAWKSMDSGMRRRFIKMSTESITLIKPAPNWLLLDVSWLFYDTHSLFFILQGKAQREAWTEDENSIIRDLYPYADRATVLAALPRRNWITITNQAMHLEVTRAYQRNNSTLPKGLSMDDAAFMAHAGLELETADQRVWYKDVVQNNDSSSRTIPIWQFFKIRLVPPSQ